MNLKLPSTPHHSKTNLSQQAAMNLNDKSHSRVVNFIKKAADFMNKGDLRNARDRLKKALKIEPNNFDSLQMFALTLQYDKRYSEAIEYYEKAMLIFDPSVIAVNSYIKVLLNTGWCYGSLDKFEQAIEFYTAVLEIDMTNTMALARRARLYIENGYLKEGYADQKLVIFYPDREEYKHLGLRFSAHTSIMQSTHIKPDETDIKMLIKDIDECNDTQHKLKYEFALANGYEKLGDYDKAFQAFKRGNDQKRKIISYRRAETNIQAQQILEVVTPQLMKKYAEIGDYEFKPIFVLGLPRSGTTVTESMLGAHPQVEPAGELSFISDIAMKAVKTNEKLGYPRVLNELKPEFLKSLGNFYKENTKEFLQKGNITFVDKMPGNFWNISLIFTLFPNAKVIHLYKNPLDACISLFRQHFAHGHHYCYNMGDLGEYYCAFRKIMKHYNNLFGDKIYNLSYEKFVNDIDVEAPKLFEYCDLEWDAKYLDFYKSKRKVKTASVQQIRKGIYTSAVERWKKYDIGDNLIILKKALREYLPEDIGKEIDEFDAKTKANLDKLKDTDNVKHFDINMIPGKTTFKKI